MRLDRKVVLFGGLLAAPALAVTWLVVGPDASQPAKQAAGFPWNESLTRASQPTPAAARSTRAAQSVGRATGTTPVASAPPAPRADERAPSSPIVTQVAPSALPAAQRDALPTAQRDGLATALESVDWQRSLRTVIDSIRETRAAGRRPSADAALEFARLDVALGEAAKVLGLSGPTAALADPRVRAEVVPAWLGALGVDLDPTQVARLADRCRAAPPADAGPDASPLEAAETAMRGRLALEESVAAVLTPRQLRTYAANVVHDPLLRTDAPRVALAGSTARGLVHGVVSHWTREFRLGEREAVAAATIAARYAQAALGLPPVDPRLGPVARRLASMQRALRLVQLQRDAERSLATNGALDAASRARAERGSARCLQLDISSR